MKQNGYGKPSPKRKKMRRVFSFLLRDEAFITLIVLCWINRLEGKLTTVDMNPEEFITGIFPF